MKIKICKDSLTNVYKKVFEEEKEVCGILEEKGECHHARNNTIMAEGNMCQHEFYSAYIYHTHPLEAKPYPSIQDLLKVLKHQTIHYSYIFTIWGTWEITVNSKTKTKNEEILSKIKKKYLGDK